MSDHNKCPSSEKEHEKCIFRVSCFHRIEPSNIKLCDKKHPQDCLFHTIFNECRNGDSCRYHHKNSIVSNLVNEDKYRELEEKYIAL